MQPKYRHQLPQLGDELTLTDGGMETTLLFHDGLDLPDFAAFVLLSSEEGRAALTRYATTYAELAATSGVGIIIDTATWRASSDWGDRLGYSAEQLFDVNVAAVELVDSVRHLETSETPIVISGAVGPRGDGYVAGVAMTVREAEVYHGPQIRALAAGGADMISGITMTTATEAAGLALAARDADMPVAISFTVETDGRLPDGQALGDAIAFVNLVTDEHPAYFMINCAHPTHFADALGSGGPWVRHIRGVRANASKMTHAELDEAVELDTGDPEELADDYRRLRQLLPNLSIVGGCCGTDHRHVGAIATSLLGLAL